MANVNLSMFAAQIADDKDVFGRMDPYFIIFSNGRQVFRSSVLPGGGTNPRWNDNFSLMVQGNEMIEFRIYDRDTMVDDSIGKGQIPAATLMTPGMKQVPIYSFANSGLLTFMAQPMGGMGMGMGMGGMGMGMGGMGMGPMGGMGGMGMGMGPMGGMGMGGMGMGGMGMGGMGGMGGYRGF